MHHGFPRALRNWTCAGVLMVLAATFVVSLDLSGQKPPPRKAKLPPVDIVTHWTDEQGLALLRGAGVQHTRMTLYWYWWKDDPAYRLDFAEVIRRLSDANIEITVVVHDGPLGTYAAREQIYADFAAFVAERASQFPSVSTWQLWNEQNAGWTPIFGWGVVSLREQGRNYARMLNLATPAIKSANPNASVIVGGLAAAYVGGSCDSGLSQFMSGVYDGRGQHDGWALQTYGAPVWWVVEACGVAVRDLMRKQRDRRALWLTEFGIDDAHLQSAWGLDTPEQWDAEQKKQWEEVVLWNDSNKVYSRLVGYVLEDGFDFGYSIVRSDRTTLRATYHWLKQRNGG
jgi:hypothetical protein